MKQIPDTARRHHVKRASPIRRPPLPRAQPIRNFAGVFGAPAKSSRAPAEEQRGGTDKRRASKVRDGKASPGRGAGKSPLGTPAATVARGVNAGYRVIEEYLRQGQDFARSLWPGGGGGRASGPAGTAAAPLNMTERMIRSASDLAALFSEFLQTFSLPGALPAPGSTPIPDFGIGRQSAAGPSAADPPASGARRTGWSDGASTGGASAGTAEATTISIDLRSRRRTAVTAFVQPGGWKNSLHVHDLRALGGEAKAARLTGVTATGIAADRRVVITVEVPDALAPGTYSGLIVDGDSNVPRGTLSVQVFAGSASSSAHKGGRTRQR